MGHPSIRVTMDIYGHLMEATSNQETASKIGGATFGENSNYGTKMVAETKKDLQQVV
jgi:hypothetical protein